MNQRTDMVLSTHFSNCLRGIGPYDVIITLVTYRWCGDLNTFSCSGLDDGLRSRILGRELKILFS